MSEDLSAAAFDALPEERGSLREVALVFLRLGWTAFGGPAAHVAMMRREMVEQRRWLPDQEFLDLFGAANLIPGPSSTELAILLGFRRAGWRALILAGVLFILPAMLLVYSFAWAYVRFGTLPAAEHILYGIKPAIIAVIVTALWGLRRTALKGVPHVVAGLAAFLLFLVGVSPLLLLAAGGLFLVLVTLARRLTTRGANRLSALAVPITGLAHLYSLLGRAPALLRSGIAEVSAGPLLQSAQVSPAGYHPLTLFLTFLKIGSVLYGSGYVLLAFLRDDFVTRLHWLTNQQLIDAVAVGQFTPGPVFTTATFVGYLTGGWGGGLIATLAIFLPSFFFCAIVLRLVPLTKRWPLVRAALDGVNAAAVGLMAAVTWQLGRAAVVDRPSALIALVALALLLRFSLNSAWLVLAGGAAGLLLKWLI
ncbi:MAG: chromate efflux transporter [Dehalococcoidia bacterium]